MKIKYLILLIVILLAACSKAGAAPMAVVSKTEIREWQADKYDFFEKNLVAWPDLNLFYALFADEATFTDPVNDDFVDGKDNIISMFQIMTQFLPNIKIETTRRFISTDGIAYDNIWHNIWQPGIDHPPIHELDLVQFQEDLVNDFTIMYSKQSLEMVAAGCFAVEKCPELQEIVDRYLAAWSSGDEGLVVALYSEEAVFSDSLLGMDAVGPGEIGELASQRFGPVGDITLEEVGLYAQTDGSDAPTEEQPEMGRIVGVGIHYRWDAAVDGESNAVESLTTLYLNEHGLITREEVFHDPDSFLAAGLAP